MIRHIQFVCLSAVLVVFVGCAPPPVTDGSMYLDNTTDQPMIVSVDGIDLATVAAGETDSFTVPLGQHVVRVTSGDEIIHEQMHDLEYALPRTQPCFLLNTSQDHRYCRVEIVYGNDDLSQGVASGLTSMIANAACRQAVGDDPEAQKKWIAEQTRKQEYKKVLGGMFAFGKEPISRFGRCRYFLAPLPSVVVGSRNSYSEKRSVVVRIPNELYDEIERLTDLEMPTEADLEYAYTLKSQVTRFVDDLEG